MPKVYPTRRRRPSARRGMIAAMGRGRDGYERGSRMPKSPGREVANRAMAWRSAVDAARAFAVEAVYPRRCSGCGRRGTWVCSRCRADLAPFEPPWCGGCGIPLALGRCRCAELDLAVHGARAAAPFAGWLRGAIHAFKYQDEPARADHLGDELAAVVERLGGADGLVPVPLHPSRERRRGYNQASLLASRVGALTGIPNLDGLRRIRSTEHQVGLGAIERLRNVEGAFAIQLGVRSPAGRRLVLIDDVLTTGSTVNACATELRAAGAAEVWVVTLAREM